MKNLLIKERALIKFQRYYMHGVRNNFDSERSSTEAMFKVREEVLAELRDYEFANNAEREELWSQILVDLTILRNCLSSVVIDKARMEELRSMRKAEEAELNAAANGLTSSMIGHALVKGIEELSKEGKNAAGS